MDSRNGDENRGEGRVSKIAQISAKERAEIFSETAERKNLPLLCTWSPLSTRFFGSRRFQESERRWRKNTQRY